MSVKYRSDIDGLRAIAVTLVVLYHAYPLKLQKGFIGVDLFFVISGYLITGILLRELQRGKISLIEFYARRFRRILPSFLTVIVSALMLGLIFLKKEEWGNLFRHASASFAFVENILLFLEVDYFDRAAEYKPLLHIWSLSVEEQFYIVFPLLLILFRDKMKWLPFIFVSIIVISFSINILLLEKLSLELAKAHNFYMLYARLWELVFGALAAWIMLKPKPLLIKFQASILCEIVNFICFSILILGAFSIITDRIPTIFAVIPAFVVILIGEKTWFNRHVLSMKPLVYLGLISYPLYLWHWVLFSVLRIYEIEMVIVICVILSALTYHYIEKPLRYHAFDNAKLVKFSIALLFGLSFITAMVSLLPAINSKPVHYRNEISGLSCPYQGGNCTANFKGTENHAVLWGDSHAGHFYTGLAESSTPVSLLMTPSCQPFAPDIQQFLHFNPKNCLKKNSDNLQLILKEDTIKTVIFSFFQSISYEKYASSSKSKQGFQDAFLKQHENVLEPLLKANKRVIIVIDAPVLKLDWRICDKWVLFSKPPQCYVTATENRAHNQDYFDLLEKIKLKFPLVEIYNPTPLFCDEVKCSAKLNGEPLYIDKDHLSLFGSQLVAKDLEKIINNKR